MERCCVTSQAVLNERQRFLLLVLYLASKYTRERIVTLGRYVVPSRIRVMKLVFLLQKESFRFVNRLTGGSLYVFEPYLHGPFSREVLLDLEELERGGFIEIHSEPIDAYGMAVRYIYVLTSRGVEEAEKMIEHVKSSTDLRDALEHIEALVKKYAPMSTDELLNYVYRNYPEDSIIAFQ